MSAVLTETEQLNVVAGSAPMSLGQLLDGLVDPRLLAAHREIPIRGVYDDSRQVQPGGLFVALRGSAADGGEFVADAVARGAACVVGAAPGSAGSAIGLAVDDARALLAQVAARWYHLPRGALKLLGVTGTNGKTTTAFMTQQILRAAGQRCAMLGTVQYDLCARTVTADMTTPGPLQLARYLREAADAGATAAALEVSSHALDQRRTDGLIFAAAAFTNLTGDHLDYHKTFDHYAAAKARLFESLDAGAAAVVNVDDPAHEQMVRGCRAQVVRYSLHREADISARITRETARGTHYRLCVAGCDLVLENAIVGRHNVYNAMAAVGLARAAGAPSDAIVSGLAAVRNIPGRLQRVPCVSGADVFVDYAHTDDALRNVLSVVRPLTRGRLIVVFGCGGDRDRTKRPRMARVAAELADLIFVTSDNPRTEAPDAIIDEIMHGFDAAAQPRVRREADRRAAIHAALRTAGEGDLVVIAGKGHENYQILGTQRIHFDDVEVAIEAAAELARQRAARTTG